MPQSPGGRSWRDKGEKMIDSRGKILDGWLSLWEIEIGESHHRRKPQGNETWMKIKNIGHVSNNHVFRKIQNTSVVVSVIVENESNQVFIFCWSPPYRGCGVCFSSLALWVTLLKMRQTVKLSRSINSKRQKPFRNVVRKKTGLCGKNSQAAAYLIFVSFFTQP